MGGDYTLEPLPLLSFHIFCFFLLHTFMRFFLFFFAFFLFSFFSFLFFSFFLYIFSFIKTYQKKYSQAQQGGGVSYVLLAIPHNTTVSFAP